MRTFYVSYMIHGKADRQHLYFYNPATHVDSSEIVRAIVKHEFPKDPDPYLSGRCNARTRAINKYRLSGFRF